MRLLGALRHNCSGAPIFSIKTNVAWCPHNRGVTTEVQGGRNSPGAESLWGRQITAGGAEKSQQCHKYFLPYSSFASERPQVRTWGGRQTCFLPRAPSDLVTSLPHNTRVHRAKNSAASNERGRYAMRK